VLSFAGGEREGWRARLSRNLARFRPRKLEIVLYFQILFEISKPNRIQIKFELRMTHICKIKHKSIHHHKNKICSNMNASNIIIYLIK
jgi:hypothetical protein